MPICFHLMPEKAEITSSETLARSALNWAIVFPEDFRDFLVRQAHHLGLGHPGEFAMAYLGVGQGVAGPPFPADVEVVAALAVAGVPQLAAHAC